jgi:hypothetical protein
METVKWKGDMRQKLSALGWFIIYACLAVSLTRLVFAFSDIRRNWRETSKTSKVDQHALRRTLECFISRVVWLAIPCVSIVSRHITLGRKARSITASWSSGASGMYRFCTPMTRFLKPRGFCWSRAKRLQRGLILLHGGYSLDGVYRLLYYLFIV